MSEVPKLEIKKTSTQVFDEKIPKEIRTWDLSEIKIEPDNTNKKYKKVTT